MFKSLFKPKALNFISPMDGEIMPLEKVSDQVFASLAMGDGFAIKMSSNTIVSPVDGEVVAIFPTKHAIGLLGNDGNEYLIHVGFDTVNLKGEGFELAIAAGDKVKQGDLLLTIDLDVMKKHNVDLTSPVVVTNLEQRQVKLLVKGVVTQGQPDILQITN